MGFSRAMEDSIGDLPENVVETLKGLGAESVDDYESLPDFNDDHIQVLQGGDHITFEGLIDMAHKDGIKLTYTEPVVVPDQDEIKNGAMAMFRAVVVTSRGVFTAHGDANQGDTMVDAVIRMAETRALCRALRQAVNAGGAAAAEMPGSTDGVEVE